MPNQKRELTGHTRLAERKGKIEGHPAILDDYQEGGFYKIPLELIKANPHQPRQFFNKKLLNELAQSIKQNGIIQPLAVQKDKEGNIIMLAGERRLRAAKLAGLTEVPAVFTGGDPAEIALIENIQRQNLNPIEEAQAYAKMIDEHDYTQDQLSKVVGKSRINITETLSINKLPDEIKKICLRVDIPKRLLIQVARQKTSKSMLSSFNKIKTTFIQGKEPETPPKRRRSSPLEAAIKHIANLKMRIEKIDQKALTEPEKESLYNIIKEARNYLSRILK
jgi:ParB family chromosome partitioning protein